MFGPEREEISGGLIILHSEELRNFYYLLEVGYVARKKACKWVQNFCRQLKGRDLLEDLGIDGKIMLQWILYK